MINKNDTFSDRKKEGSYTHLAAGRRAQQDDIIGPPILARNVIWSSPKRNLEVWTVTRGNIWEPIWGKWQWPFSFCPWGHSLENHLFFFMAVLLENRKKQKKKTPCPSKVLAAKGKKRKKRQEKKVRRNNPGSHSRETRSTWAKCADRT
jgi:hypothetical protein